MATLVAASLFSGAGIGDLGFRAAGLDVLAQCEIEPDRAALAALNFPGAGGLVADVWQATDRCVQAGPAQPPGSARAGSSSRTSPRCATR